MGITGWSVCAYHHWWGRRRGKKSPHPGPLPAKPGRREVQQLPATHESQAGSLRHESCFAFSIRWRLLPLLQLSVTPTLSRAEAWCRQPELRFGVGWSGFA